MWKLFSSSSFHSLPGIRLIIITRTPHTLRNTRVLRQQVAVIKGLSYVWFIPSARLKEATDRPQCQLPRMVMDGEARSPRWWPLILATSSVIQGVIRCGRFTALEALVSIPHHSSNTEDLCKWGLLQASQGSSPWLRPPRGWVLWMTAIKAERLPTAHSSLHVRTEKPARPQARRWGRGNAFIPPDRNEMCLRRLKSMWMKNSQCLWKTQFT